MSDESDPRPWKRAAYQRDIIAEELGINFRETYLKNRFKRAEVETIGENRVELVYDTNLPSYLTSADSPEWYTVTAIYPADDGGICVTLEVEK